ncbi:hypothetical protein ANN_17011 [Periplaneta americana]|uniref:Acyltransferase n=1 Tax=Periplaneta americana TaxID=6978 RepID=A0ABQ8SST2_PERAM|nr:hypothetical protein ANN_17011 [Periplaneta americana]
MELLGVRFAPLNTPLERRLQTLAACCWFITLAFGPMMCISFMAYVILCTRYSILALLYLMWIWYDRDICNKGGRRSKWARQWRWWKYFCNYFPIRLVKTVDLDPAKSYMLCVFPHGVLSTGAFGSFATDGANFSEIFPGLTPYLVTLAGHFVTPFIRELCLILGGCPASVDGLSYVLSRPGNAVALVVGGASESLECRPGTYRIILKRRKGFVKLALKYGNPLVPVFSFGETDLYDQLKNPKGSWLRRAQELCRKITGIAPVVPLGRGLFQYSFGIVPQRRPVTTVGKYHYYSFVS